MKESQQRSYNMTYKVFFVYIRLLCTVSILSHSIRWKTVVRDHFAWSQCAVGPIFPFVFNDHAECTKVHCKNTRIKYFTHEMLRPRMLRPKKSFYNATNNSKCVTLPPFDLNTNDRNLPLINRKSRTASTNYFHGIYF